MPIYEDFKEAGLETGNHCSDLHVRDTPKAREILEKYGKTPDGWNVVQFRSDDEAWLDIPFQYPDYRRF